MKKKKRWGRRGEIWTQSLGRKRRKKGKTGRSSFAALQFSRYFPSGRITAGTVTVPLGTPWKGTSPRNFPPTVRARAAGRSASVSLYEKRSYVSYHAMVLDLNTSVYDIYIICKLSDYDAMCMYPLSSQRSGVTGRYGVIPSLKAVTSASRHPLCRLSV